MDAIKNMYDDSRKIKSLIYPDSDGVTSVDESGNGIEKIVPYYENGEMAPVVWFAIYLNGKVAERINGKYVGSVIYF